MRRSPRAGLWVLLLAALVTVGSCSNDPLESSTADLIVRYVPSPAGAGRYETGQFDVVTIRILPEDPALAHVYGGDELVLRFTPFTVNLLATQPVAVSHIALVPGRYVVKLIQFNPPLLVDQTIPTNPATCLEGVAGVPSGPAGGQVPAIVEFVDEPAFAFTVHPGQTQLALKVNVPGLISGYESSFTCGDCGGGNPCLLAFDLPTYMNALLANVTLE